MAPEAFNGTLAPGRTISGRYRVERTLGLGGMGVVYEVVHVNLGRRFALKLLHPGVSWNGEAMERFRHEAQVTSRIGHPNIIDVVDFDTSEAGEPYLVMEFLEGEPLGRRLERGPLEPATAVSIGYQTALALAAAHRLGVIHRDLKPDNIYLCSRGSWPDFVKVLDFGISKILGSTTVLTGNQALLGSPRFMAPEQAMGRSAQCDARTDVHALGVLLWESLSGRAAFDADNVPAVLSFVCTVTPPLLHTLSPGISPALAAVVARALQKAPADRYQSMEELAQALVQALPEDQRSGLAFRMAAAPPIPLTNPAPPVPPLVPGLRDTAISQRDAAAAPIVPPIPAATPSRSRRRLWIGAAAIGAMLLSGGVGWHLARRPTPAPVPAPAALIAVPAPPPARLPPPRAQALDASAEPPDAAAPEASTPAPVINPPVTPPRVAPPTRPPARPAARPRPTPAPASPAVPSPAPTAAPATLVVTATVLSKVYLDGRLVDETPARLTGLAPGPHSLEVVGSLDPSCRSSRTVTLEAGQVTRVSSQCP